MQAETEFGQNDDVVSTFYNRDPTAARFFASAIASYPASNVVIGFDEHVTNETALKEFIKVCGFSVA